MPYPTYFNHFFWALCIFTITRNSSFNKPSFVYLCVISFMFHYLNFVFVTRFSHVIIVLCNHRNIFFFSFLWVYLWFEYFWAIFLAISSIFGFQFILSSFVCLGLTMFFMPFLHSSYVDFHFIFFLSFKSQVAFSFAYLAPPPGREKRTRAIPAPPASTRWRRPSLMHR